MLEQEGQLIGQSESITFFRSGYTNPVTIRNSLPLYGWRLRVLLAAFCLFGMYFPFQFGWIAALLVIVWIVRGWLMGRRRRVAETGGEKSFGLYEGDDAESARIACIGFEHQLEPLQDIQAGFFEPCIIRSSRYEQPRPTALSSLRWRLVIIFLLVVAPFVLSFWMSLAGSLCVEVLTYLVAEFIAAIAFPIYFRISPGKLEVLSTTSPWGELRVERTMSLLDCRVLCQLDFDKVYVREMKSKDIVQEINLADMAQADLLVRRLLQAAISRVAVPDLPSDELVG